MSAHSNTRSVELRHRVIEPLANHVDRPTLVILSRVSRRWNAGANDVLWRHLRSFLPLLRLLRPRKVGNIWVGVPKYVWRIKLCDLFIHHCRFLRPPFVRALSPGSMRSPRAFAASNGRRETGSRSGWRLLLHGHSCSALCDPPMICYRTFVGSVQVARRCMALELSFLGSRHR